MNRAYVALNVYAEKLVHMTFTLSGFFRSPLAACSAASMAIGLSLLRVIHSQSAGHPISLHAYITPSCRRGYVHKMVDQINHVFLLDYHCEMRDWKYIFCKKDGKQTIKNNNRIQFLKKSKKNFL